MKQTKILVWSFILLVVVAALYRIIPGRPYGFAPQWAMAVFAGAVIRNKKWALIMPVLSMFISDLLYQLLYMGGLTDMQGFYQGQWQNYLLFTLLVFVGFAIRKYNVTNIIAASLAAPTIYFLLSNFIVWFGVDGTRGYGRPKTFNGLMMCYSDGLPFYRNSLIATLVFSAILFGSYYVINRKINSPSTANC
ncbi:MAG TPA: DUF6580 family putative transport protein [Puia sp.]|nr:DUF6580 family putative transport protein [Puia sp.]